ncbi:PAS domain S-box protein [Fortiea sp. LEGE XX443]|uniref:hybrid sensor histidine kinase/response regulator n=1 Tax=Fortiea sp. LEGE XX443 TaxID=1828611 RepID=UPI001882F85B|nr:PAS domain-containing sensor histidine kinase [Fortiea sp. LEGE XX443]MBE9006500.1 PAS domain S-box protein [Fortiea sp. LEGE XX443]
MMIPDDLPVNLQIEAAQQRLEQIQQQANSSSNTSDHLISVAIAELSIALEELSIAAAKLHRQNQELLETRQMLDWERQRYQDLFNFAPEAYLVTDEQGIILEANQAAQTLLNIRHNYLVGKPLILFVTSKYHSVIYQHLEKLKKLLAENGENVQRQQQNIYLTAQQLLQNRKVSLKPRQKKVLPAALSLSAECDRQGLTRLCWSFRDLSDRQQAAQKLKASEKQYCLLFENYPLPMWIFDPQTLAFLVVNQAAIAHYGYSQAEFLAMTLVDICPPEDISAFQKHMEQYRLSDYFVYHREWRHCKRDRSIIDVEITSTRIIWEGKLADFMMVKDISALKQTEQKIREQAALIDIATDAIFVQDLANHILFWSKGAERLYGWTAEESYGQKADQLFYKKSSHQLHASLNATVETGFWDGELHQITKTGKEIIVESRWTLVRDESGQPKSILIVNTDITNKKQIERQFYHSQRLENLGILASGIAHDLNNVFAPIVMISQLLTSKFPKVDTRTQELFKTLENSSKRGTNLVQQILSFARSSEEKYILLQVSHLLREVVQIIKQTFPKSIEIKTEIPTNSLGIVKADPTQLHQVFMNLVVNARDAMSNGGILKISAENRLIDATYAGMSADAHQGNYIVVTISDTGVGISAELVERIFEPFFTTKELGQGTGLGLSTVLGIVKNHGGFVEVQSELNKGTQFQVYLPAAQGTTTEQIIEEELLQGNGELILIVDDEEFIQQTTKLTLEKNNYKTIIAHDGIETLALYPNYKAEISVVLMDMMMPNMDGLMTTRILCSINPDVKIIATSGLSTHRQKLLKAGAKAFLSKPYTTHDLLQSLSQVIATNTAGDR